MGRDEPTYIQVAEVIATRIESGEITHKLPAERALAEEFGVAYQTVRSLTGPADLDDQQYAEAIATLGQQALVELSTLVGYYAALALQLRIFRVAGPDS